VAYLRDRSNQLVAPPCRLRLAAQPSGPPRRSGTAICAARTELRKLMCSLNEDLPRAV